MIITGKTCYSRLLWLMCAGELFSRAVSRLDFTAPNFEHEGVAGYIETTYTIEVRDLKTFAAIWDAWYSLTEVRRLNLYGLAKGLGDCK